MGGTFYSDEAAEARVADRVAAGKPAVSSYTADIRSGVVASKVHKDLDPKGLVMRESRDSEAHPEAVPVILVLDETGSMERVITQIQKSVRSIMKLLISKGYLPHPHIMVMGIGDVPNGEVAPLQVSQFEADDKIEQNIDNLYIERDGGGQNYESYQNAAYVAAYKTSTDHYEKRGQRGYMFIIGDELNHIFKAEEVRKLIGTTAEMGPEIDELTNETIYAKLRQQFNTFFVLPKNANNGGDKVVISHWKKLLGDEQVLQLADENAAGEFIAAQIGLCEQNTDIDTIEKDLVDIHGPSAKTTALIRAVRGSVSTTAAGEALTKMPKGSLVPGSAPVAVERL